MTASTKVLNTTLGVIILNSPNRSYTLMPGITADVDDADVLMQPLVASMIERGILKTGATAVKSANPEAMEAAREERKQDERDEAKADAKAAAKAASKK